MSTRTPRPRRSAKRRSIKSTPAAGDGRTPKGGMTVGADTVLRSIERVA